MKIRMHQIPNQVTAKVAEERFISKKIAENCAVRTVEYYRIRIGQFLDYYGPDELISEITEDTFDGYIYHLRTTTSANDTTINSYLRAVRAFLYYLMKQGYVRSFTCHLPKAEKKLKETYTDAELKLLLKKPDVSTCTFREFRTWAMISYILATGNRIETVRNLRIRDLDFENGLITLTRTKNRKQQIIPMANALQPVLREFLDVRGGDADSYIFCSETGSQATYGSLRDGLRKYNRKRGVNKTSAHLFRHTFAKKWIMAGGDIFRLQKMLGHSDLTVTKEYLSIFGTDLQQDFNKFNPLDTLSQGTKRIRMS